MNYLPLVLGAYFLNSITVTIDKFLLAKKSAEPIQYIFYLSAFSLTSLFLLPVTHVPGLITLTLASLATLLWTGGAYYMFKAIQLGHVARVVPVIGSSIPVLLGLYALINGTISYGHGVAIIILVLGLMILTAPDWRGTITKRELLFEAIAVILFAASYIVLRQAYLHDAFLTVFVWSRPILLVAGAVMLAVPAWRSRIFSNEKSSMSLLSKTGALFLAGQMAGGLSELMLTFSISLADPALVNSLQGTQYVFLFILSLVLAKKFPKIFHERLTTKILIGKVMGISCITLGLYLIAF